jgi:hypothetical protein
MIQLKRPVGILRYNAEVMRDNGAPQEFIAKYLQDNGSSFEQIIAVPTPNEEERARMLNSEKDGSFIKQRTEFEKAKEQSEASRKSLERLENIQGGVRSFGSGLFLNFGDEAESAITGQPIEEIRKEQNSFASKYPMSNLALSLAGGIAPALTGFGAPNTAATLGGRMLTGAGVGAGLGAVSGYGAGEQNIANRAESALASSLLGGGIGAVVPAATSALASTGRIAGRILRGIGKNPSDEAKIGDFMLKNIVEGAGKPGSQARIDAGVLLQGAQRGDEAILNAATNLENKMVGMSKMSNPYLVESALEPRWTAQTPSVQKIIESLTTGSKKQASKEFGEFVSKQPEKTGAGLVLNSFFKRNPVAKEIVRVNQRRIGDELTTYNGLQKIEETLRNNLPKTLDTSRAVNRNAKILDAIDDLSSLRETLFPGQKAIDAKYAAAINAIQEPSEKKAQSFISQIATGVPYTNNPELSLTGAARLGFSPYIRGKARELIERGSLRPEYKGSLDSILQGLGFSGLDAILKGK